jgi:hypothetical protein
VNSVQSVTCTCVGFGLVRVHDAHCPAAKSGAVEYVALAVAARKATRRRRYMKMMCRRDPRWGSGVFGPKEDHNDCGCGYGCPPFQGCRHP